MQSDGKIKITVQEALEHLLTRSVYQDRALLASAEVIKQLTLHLRNPARYSEDSHRGSIDQLQAAVDALRVLDGQWRAMHTERMGREAPAHETPAAAPAPATSAPAASAPANAPVRPVPAAAGEPAPATPLHPPAGAPQPAVLAAVRTLQVPPPAQSRAASPDLAAAFDPRRDDGAII